MKAKELFPGIFSRHAEAYARRHAEIRAAGGEAARNRMLELVAAKPGELVLDVACGPGNLAVQLTGARARVVGIDLADGMLAVARRECPAALGFLKMDGERLGFRDGVFDAVVCGHGYQFMPDLGRALEEARRVLRAGGRLGATLGITAPRSDEMAELAERWLAARPDPVDTWRTRDALADRAALQAALAGAGFGAGQVEMAAERIVWRDPEHAVRLAMSFWDLASRIELTEPARVEAFRREALDALRARYGEGPIEREARALVLYAVA